MTPRRPLATFRLDKDLLERLTQAAIEIERPVSWVIRKAISEWLDRRDSRAKVGATRRSQRRRNP